MAYKIEHDFSYKFICGENDPLEITKDHNFVAADIRINKEPPWRKQPFHSHISFFVDLKLMCKLFNLENQRRYLPHHLIFETYFRYNPPEVNNININKFIKSNENFAYANVVNLQSDKFVQFITKYGTPSGLSDESFEKLENEILTPMELKDIKVDSNIDLLLWC